MQNNNWMNHPDLKNMEPRKKKIIINLTRQAKGISMQQALPYIMEAQKELTMQGLSFSPQEKTILFSILTQDMSPQEKQKFETFKNMMGLQ